MSFCGPVDVCLFTCLSERWKSLFVWPGMTLPCPCLPPTLPHSWSARPMSLLKYWPTVLGLDGTHPAAFDSCCLIGIVLIVHADSLAPARPGSALCNQGPRMGLCKRKCGSVCTEVLCVCVWWWGCCEFVYPSLWSCVQECLLWQYTATVVILLRALSSLKSNSTCEVRGSSLSGRRWLFF